MSSSGLVHVLILVLVDLGGKVYRNRSKTRTSSGLNPCFGGFGWESWVDEHQVIETAIVLILVLVDLGGKDNTLPTYC